MEKDEKHNYYVALDEIQKFEKKIANDPSGVYHNRKQLDLYWMCTDICAHTNVLMNQGLSKLFNQLAQHKWINFKCQNATESRYGFKFTPATNISLTSAGVKELGTLA